MDVRELTDSDLEEIIPDEIGDDDDVKEAVETYQKSKSISADGVAGAATMDSMGLY